MRKNRTVPPCNQTSYLIGELHFQGNERIRVAPGIIGEKQKADKKAERCQNRCARHRKSGRVQQICADAHFRANGTICTGTVMVGFRNEEKNGEGHSKAKQQAERQCCEPLVICAFHGRPPFLSHNLCKYLPEHLPAHRAGIRFFAKRTAARSHPLRSPDEKAFRIFRI